jgi:hypothetical protein
LIVDDNNFVDFGLNGKRFDSGSNRSFLVARGHDRGNSHREGEWRNLLIAQPSDVCVETGIAARQRLKPHRFYGVYVVAKATTHKYSVVAAQTLRSVLPKINLTPNRESNVTEQCKIGCNRYMKH